MFLLEIYEATGDSAYITCASDAGAYLAASTPDIILAKTSTGLYHGGAAGMAFALRLLNERAPSPPLVVAYDALVQYIVESAVPGPHGGLVLNEYPGLRWGTAGIGLFLLQVCRTLALGARGCIPSILFTSECNRRPPARRPPLLMRQH